MKQQTIIITTEGERRMLLDRMRSAPLPLRVSVCRHRKRRSDRQNAYYWPCFVQPFAEWLSEQHGDSVSEDRAHEILKDTFLRTAQTNANGEVLFDLAGNPLMATRSTTDLTTLEFNEYLDNCANLIAELCGFSVPEPGTYREKEAGDSLNKRMAGV